MKGKTRPSTRYDRFKEAVLGKFAEKYPVSNFVSFLRTKSDISYELSICCDENDMLLDDKVTMPHALWQVFRLLDKPVLLRDLEVFGSSTYHNFNLSSTRNKFYTAISLLYSINLIDYTFRDFDGRPSDTIQFFIKEEELTPTVEE